MHADNQDEHVDTAVEIFRILSDRTRVGLLRILGSGEPGSTGPWVGSELSVGALADALGARPSTVSQHLAKLRMARLVTTRRDGTQILYRIANEHVSQLVADALRHSEHLGSGTPAHHLAADEYR